MIDVYNWKMQDSEGNWRYYYRKIEVSITDSHAIPEGIPPNASLISANDWHTEAWVLSIPEIDPETEESRTFEQREAILIASPPLEWINADLDSETQVQ